MSRFAMTIALLMMALLGAGAYGYFQYCREQARLTALLQQVDHALSLRNDNAVVSVQGFVKGMEVAVVKNQNQPREIAFLHRARALENRVTLLLDTLQHWRNQLRRASGNSAAPALLNDGNASGPGAALLGSGTRGRLALGQQVAACADTLQRLGSTPDSKPLLLPNFDHLPLVEALTALTQLESQLLAHEQATLRHMATRLGARHLPIRYTAAATSETATVAPGSTYRGSLLLVKSFQLPDAKMFCNGQPVFVDTDGVGQVQFRAPSRPGPATWLGAIHFVVNGRDTTFQVRVPYRVARR